MRALYAIAYLVTLGVAFVLGRTLAAFAGVGSSGSPAIFVLVLACVAVLVWLGFVFEEPLIWARMPGRDSRVPSWIGQPRSPRLAAAAPPPASLGLAIGLFSALLT